MDERRLGSILHTWRLSTDLEGRPCQITPSAHVARAQVLELVTEVRLLRSQLANAEARASGTGPWSSKP